jgi:hypothetical protein
MKYYYPEPTILLIKDEDSAERFANLICLVRNFNRKGLNES